MIALTDKERCRVIALAYKERCFMIAFADRERCRMISSTDKERCSMTLQCITIAGIMKDLCCCAIISNVEAIKPLCHNNSN
jgi:hypothetical protein